MRISPKIRSVLKWFFVGWGILSFALALIIAALIARRFSDWPEAKPSVDVAQKNDVRFVLNWCGLGETRTEAVINSYTSPRSFTGDHVDAYAIKVRGLGPADMKPPAQSSDGGWVRCDQLDATSRDALRLAAAFSSSPDTAWFPSEEELASSRYFLWVWSITLHGRRATAAKLIFARPEDGMLFYSSVKT